MPDARRNRAFADPAMPPKVPVTVRLFGILAVVTHARVIELLLPARATVADVFCELGNRFGVEFLERLQRAPGELHSYCSVFVNGEQVNELNRQLAPDAAGAEVGVILFMASEGG